MDSFDLSWVVQKNSKVAVVFGELVGDASELCESINGQRKPVKNLKVRVSLESTYVFQETLLYTT